MSTVYYEFQHRLWSEYVAITTTLNGLIWLDFRGDIKKYNFYKHTVMSFPEWLKVNANHPNAENSIGQYSFLDNIHYNLKGSMLESFDQLYQRS